jgi:plastocyanin
MLKFAFLFAASLRLGAAQIDITPGFPFSPSHVTVTAGDTLHWQFMSSHTVASINDFTSFSYNGLFHSPGGPDYFLAAPAPGTYYYYCEVHGSAMRGSFYVQAALSTATPSPPSSPTAKTFLGPVPVKAGRPLCLAFTTAPLRTLCELYNSKGERAAKESFSGAGNACLGTQNLAPGLYFARIEEEDASGAFKANIQKIIILP